MTVYNRIWVTTATVGTGTVTTGSAVSNAFLSFLTANANAPVPDGTTVTYEINDGLDFEIGSGVYSGGTLTRATVYISRIGGTVGTTKITLSGVATVQVAIPKEEAPLLSAAQIWAAIQTFTVAPVFTDAANSRVAMGAFGVVRVQVFNASGTYTPNANMVYCIIECQGSGGGSGGIEAVAANYTTSSGGGAGAYARLLASAATIGASKTVTIGAGGTAGASGNNNGGNGNTTSVGSLCTADGGFGGSGAKSGVAIGAGGVAATTGTGDFIIPGGGGGGAVGVPSATGGFLFCGWGGSSHFGGGPACSINAAGIAGTAKTGAGAAGAQDVTGKTNRAGAAGGSGRVVITEFCTK